MNRGERRSDHSDNEREDDSIYIQNLDVNMRNYENTCLQWMISEKLSMRLYANAYEKCNNSQFVEICNNYWRFIDFIT